MLTVACTLKSGGIYTAEWVEKLQRGVKRFRPDAEFVCLSDVPVPCRRIPLEENWPGWFSKIEALRPGQFTGPVVHVDLDSIVTGDVMGLASWDFSMPRDFYRKDGFCSTVMAWADDAGEAAWHAMKADPEGVMQKYRQLGDQGHIEASLDVTPMEGVASYREHAIDGPPDWARVVAAHGRPKPHEAGGWMQAEWLSLSD